MIDAAASEGRAPAGSIFDIGYRHYDGPRLGRAHAVRSLFSHSLRSSFGIGRGIRAKLAPIALMVIAAIPAVAIVAALALLRQFPFGDAFEEQSPITYATYSATIATIVALFCAAQAPELFGRDQRHSVLALYFARALRRTDYALARIGGFIVALLILQLLPQAILFLGRVLLSPDIAKGIADDLPDVGPVLAQSLISSSLLAGVAMTVSAYTPRRAYAVAGIIAAFTIPGIVATIVAALGSPTIGVWLSLLSPTTVVDGTNAILFDTALQSGIEGADVELPRLAYLAAAAVWIAGSIVVAIRRFMRVNA